MVKIIYAARLNTPQFAVTIIQGYEDDEGTGASLL